MHSVGESVAHTLKPFIKARVDCARNDARRVSPGRFGIAFACAPDVAFI